MSAKTCCVPLCSSDRRRTSSISYHLFPKEKLQRKTWICKIRRDEGKFFKVSENTFLCSKHFKTEDFAWIPGGVRKRLKRGAVPSIFDWNPTPKERKPPTLRTAPKSTSLPECLPLTDVTNDQHKDGGLSITTNTEDGADISEEKSRMLKLEETIATLQTKLMEKEKECQVLKSRLSVERFGISRVGTNDSLIRFYTGFSSYQLFVAFFEYVKPSAASMTSAYYTPSDTISLSGRPRNLSLFDELFLFMCRLYAGLKEEDLADRFNMHLSSVSRKVITWCNFLYFVLASMPIWATREMINNHMPLGFREVYPNTRVILDCTELRTQTPGSLVLGSQLYSNYKSHNTFKGLVGIAPHGAVTFISHLYTGAASDVEMTRESGILELLEQGDDVMADKGFTISKLVEEKGATLNIPPFLRNTINTSGQFTSQEVANTQRIASVRIHVERAIRRIKEHRLYDTVIPLNLAGSINQLWAVSCLLCNFRGPLIAETEAEP